MLQQYRSFIQEICANEHLFYAFTAYDKKAETLSKDQKDEENQPKVVRCFWVSEKEALEACKNEYWQGYRVNRMSLIHFLENECIDMAEESILAGIDFNNQDCDYEINPLDLILDIIVELKRIGKTLYLRDYDNYQDFQNAIKQQKWSMKRAEIIASPEKKRKFSRKSSRNESASCFVSRILITAFAPLIFLAWQGWKVSNELLFCRVFRGKKSNSQALKGCILCPICENWILTTFRRIGI